MRPLDIQQIGEEIAIKWEDGTESYIRLEKLRRHCPCASCKGETDIMGNIYRAAPRSMPASAFRLRRFHNVGGYAVQPMWEDGHSTGIYSFGYLKELAKGPP